MIPLKLKRGHIAGAAFFILAFAFLYWVAGDILHVAGDEGIYLQGGRLVAEGRQPYRDFVAISGPLTFWIEGLLARCSAMSLSVMRLSVIFDAAFLAWIVYWFTSRYTGWLYAAGTAVAFLAYEARLRHLNVNHRWDSGAIAMVAIVLAFQAVRTRRPALWATAGFAMVAAGFATSSILVVALPLLWWCGRSERRNLTWFIGGGAIAAGIAVAYLWHERMLFPMIESMRWASANYVQANRVFYGGLLLGRIPGQPAPGWSEMAGLLITAVPAILPPLTVAGWILYCRRKAKGIEFGEVLPLLPLVAALVFSAWPRWTSDALLHTLSLSWFLFALLLHRTLRPEQRRWLGIIVLLATAGSIAEKAFAAAGYLPRETRVGAVRAPGEESEFLGGLERYVQKGDTLFSYPYLPSVYYFLAARNPTRFTFLQPGMMTAGDEHRAVTELESSPPRWVIYENYPPEAVLAIWPGTDPLRIPMPEMEAYLRASYHAIDTISGPWGQMIMLERN